MKKFKSTRRFVVPALLLFGGLIWGLGCETDGASTPGKADAERPQREKPRKEVPKGHYWMNVNVDQFKGSYTLLCNGFPVKKMWVNIIEADDEWAADMQTALVGEGNVASIRIRPFLEYSGEQLTVGTVQLEGWVEVEETRQSYVPLHKVGGAEGEGRLRAEAVDSAHAAWKKQVRTQWKKLLKEKPTPKKAFIQLKTWRWEHSMEVETTPFENRHGPDFSQIFEEAPRLKDTPATRKRLRDYAMHLRDLLRSEQAEALYREFRPSVSEELGWFKITRSGRRDSAIAHIRTDWTERWKTEFTRSEVKLRSWSEGRVWELLLRGEDGALRPFFEGEGATSLDVYVAEIDGELKVVR